MKHDGETLDCLRTAVIHAVHCDDSADELQLVLSLIMLHDVTPDELRLPFTGAIFAYMLHYRGCISRQEKRELLKGW